METWHTLAHLHSFYNRLLSLEAPIGTHFPGSHFGCFLWVFVFYSMARCRVYRERLRSEPEKEVNSGENHLSSPWNVLTCFHISPRQQSSDARLHHWLQVELEGFQTGSGCDSISTSGWDELSFMGKWRELPDTEAPTDGVFFSIYSVQSLVQQHCACFKAALCNAFNNSVNI